MEQQIILLVVLGTISIMLMGFVVVFFVMTYKRKMLQNELERKSMESQHQHELLNATLKSQEAERKRLGGELHDSVGALLSSIKLNLQVKKKEAADLEPVLDNLNESIKLVRAISHQMMPVILVKYGLRKAIEDLFEKISNETLQASVREWGAFTFDENTSLMIFRIVQELTNNSMKHAAASTIDLSLTQEDQEARFVYQDNGRGFPAKVLEKSEGLGLLSIQTRAQSIGGRVIFSNSPENGARVDLVIPLPIT